MMADSNQGPVFPGDEYNQQPAGQTGEQPTTQVPSQPTQQMGGQHYGEPTQAYTSYEQPTTQYEQPSGGYDGMPPIPSYDEMDDPKPKKPHTGLKALVFGLIGGVVGAGALTAGLYFGGVIGKSSATTSSTSQNVTINASSEDTSLATAVATKCLPSVVSISVTTSDGSGVGSGVILDTDGNILTNYHVIEDATDISVSTTDGSYEASVVGSDESSDLAVIKIDPGDTTLTPMEIGDSSSLEVGEWVMSIGSPFGLDQSVSTGIVSSLYRSTMLQNTSGNTIYTNLIQTDATINPGNSGGALVDSEGKLIGINSLIESYSGSSSGVGFAIPGNYAVEVANTIIAGKTVEHAYLGGSFQTVTAQNAKSANLSVTQGAYVASVTSGGPAEQAGIQKGDVITKLDDEEITSSDGIVLAVRSHSVGDTVKITYVRDGQENTVDVTLGSDADASNSSSEDDSSQNSLLEEYLKRYYEYYNGNGSSSDSSSGLGDSYGSGSSNGYGNSYGNSYGNGLSSYSEGDAGLSS
jgi:putative serine protease PepD